ncbi:hypothetical protein [Okeania sp. SIO2B3]|uniref:hypothetical protein n=1 Tax=Okeania sp. SIO2B3 TaxID=2607784 RepID=UPI0013C1656D|nr:hypothetical protein [Okeania sp. SIO2B3]NET43258.1 hypothetical protein [Okeania sp. SIO2B3]
MLRFIRYKLLFTIFISLLIFLYIPNLKLQKVSAQFISSPEVNALDDSLNNASIYSFIKSGLNYSKQLYGEPRIAVKKVNLRLHTTPLASLDNANQGEFTIYLSHKPSEYAFRGQLGHEIFHLLNAKLLDCYAEGMATVFAEKVLTRDNLDWSGWEAYFQQGYEPFYGLTYFMMKEVSETAGSANMSRLLDFAVNNKANKKWMYIDIDGWLSSMSDYVKIEVEKVINKYIFQVKSVIGSKNNMYTCLAPTKN